MAVPLKNDKEKHLFYPLKTTSPSFLVTKNDMFSDIKIKNCKPQSIIVNDTSSTPDYFWDGQKKEWSENMVINTKFVHTGYEEGVNLLYDTYFDSIVDFSKNFNMRKKWNVFAEYCNNPVYKTNDAKFECSDLDHIGYIHKKTGKPYSQYVLEQTNSHSNGFTVKQYGDGYNLLLSNDVSNINIGVEQYIERDLSHNEIETNMSFSLKMRTNTERYGVAVRIEFYDEFGKFLNVVKTKPISNKNAKSSVKINNTIDIPIINGEDSKNWRYARFCIYIENGSSSSPSALIKEIQCEYGSNKTPKWTKNVAEASIDTNAGEIPAPKTNGKEDLKKMIDTIAILRSNLSDDLYKWEEIVRIPIKNIKDAIYYDYFIENGDYYRYAIQPIYGDGRKGDITHYEDVVSTYDGMWILGQNDLQFSFIYNGLITNISKQKKMEQVNTIGSKYPYFVSNNNQDYRTFNFSGILTSHQDVENIFVSDSLSKTISEKNSINIPFVEDKYTLEKMTNKKTDMAEEYNNMIQQRRWREQIVNWLGDGTPKLIKSEAQGAMLVMISNIVVQPNKTTYGLIADVSFTATEVGDFNEETLKKFKLRKELLEAKELINKG